MSWQTALLCGVGLGLVSFGGLWLTVRQLVSPKRQRGLPCPSLALRANQPPLVRGLPCPSLALRANQPRLGSPRTRLVLAGSNLARLTLVAVVFCGLSREGIDKVLAGLAGLWLARCWLIHQLGGTVRAEK